MINEITAKYAKESRTIKEHLVLPPDTNHHGTMFGGEVMSYIDDVATICASKHARNPVVTASTDSVDFLRPIKTGHSVSFESFVTWTHNTSMEVFVRIISEDLLTGKREVCATSFLTFVALGPDGRPTHVPGVIPERPEEIALHESAPERVKIRRARRKEREKFAEGFGVLKPWETL
ncbi:acyl-CoA thioesterase [Aneurinibacillus tyrosinisolvens]|uniref:acyl-CoA thioesterase n=1 Tax=Aneurinibacillus tyrosinisolvens TaxID=1443435 RepID=UPI00063FB7D2|nr:acyl-CoA thioesterase [Aneurinibacillus tyrosinisolvens]